jgi:hypothetical protein
MAWRTPFPRSSIPADIEIFNKTIVCATQQGFDKSNVIMSGPFKFRARAGEALYPD